MASTLPEGEEIRKAIKWISEMRETRTDRKLSKLVEEAALIISSPGSPDGS